MLRIEFEQEIIRLKRRKISVMLIAFMITMLGLSVLVYWQHINTYRDSQQHWQQTSNHAWENQPDRHPHRVAHYGHLVFRQSSILSVLDPGVSPYTGNFLFLEAHKQNTPAVSGSSYSPGQLKFGYPSVSTIMFVLWPLVLIALTYASISDEREHNRANWLTTMGVSVGAMLFGRALVYVVISALVVGFIGLLTLLLLASADQTFSDFSGAALAGMLLVYFVYSVIWVFFGVGISALARNNESSLLSLLAVWMVTTLAIPKLAPVIAETATTHTSLVSFQHKVEQDVKKIGDSHNPNDPYYAELKQKTLDKYGVKTIEELPINWNGIVISEGERLTSEVYQRHYKTLLASFSQHQDIHDQLSVLSPTLLMMRLTQALSGNDSLAQQHFEQAAEQYRFDLIQYLNGLHANEVDLDGDDDHRLGSELWANAPKFSYQPQSFDDTTQQHTSLFAISTFWILLTGLFVMFVCRRKAI